MPRSQHPCALWLQLHTSHPPPLPLYFIFTLILEQCCHQHSTAQHSTAEHQPRDVTKCTAVSAVLVRVGTQDTSTKFKYGCHHEHCKSGALFTPCYTQVLHFAHFDSLWPYSTAEAAGHHSMVDLGWRRQPHISIVQPTHCGHLRSLDPLSL